MHSLIIDAGSTKTEWVVASAGDVLHRFITQGINPNYLDDETINANVKSFAATCSAELSSQIGTVNYYGSGCASANNVVRMTNILRNHFPKAHISVDSDLMGACRALCNSTTGIVAILGTGAAACLYDGNKITSRAPSLGYMLGDEGSGTYLGKMFLTKYLLGQLPKEINDDFEKTFSVDRTAVIGKIYREPSPNRFMASLAPFIAERIPHPFIYNFCKSCFLSFFIGQIHYFSDYQKYNLNIIGSIGYYFQNVIRECALDNKVNIGKIEASPMPSLIRQTKTL